MAVALFHKGTSLVILKTVFEEEWSVVDRLPVQWVSVSRFLEKNYGCIEAGLQSFDDRTQLK